jgi:ADP-ribose pyrophosphatase YjhB (NUDIX family)
MQRTPQFVTGAFARHHRWLNDVDYGNALDSLVKAVSDVLVTSNGGQRVFLGKRKVEPQPDWWYIGGRVQPGDSPAQGAVRNVRRELKLEVEPERFEVISNFSFVWHRRAQAPAENGTADISTVMNLEVTEEEASRAVLDQDEYSDARWFEAQEVLESDAIDSGDVKRVSIGFGPKPYSNRNPNLTGGESFADDLR